ncbi:MAG: hypothetical protein MI861_10805 [Pirellulales bacterium]|nr:hypothetical protein [Pirellulales bacterium]
MTSAANYRAEADALSGLADFNASADNCTDIEVEADLPTFDALGDQLWLRGDYEIVVGIDPVGGELEEGRYTVNIGTPQGTPVIRVQLIEDGTLHVQTFQNGTVGDAPTVTYLPQFIVMGPEVACLEERLLCQRIYRGWFAFPVTDGSRHLFRVTTSTGVPDPAFIMAVDNKKRVANVTTDLELTAQYLPAAEQGCNFNWVIGSDGSILHFDDGH